MKTLLLIRHAKSSWDNVLQKDFDRTLNERGVKDAPEMAKRLLKKHVTIDAFITSPAVRAFTTCKFFAKAYGRAETDIIQVPKLYLAPVPVFYEVVANIDNAINDAAIFSHNDGITSFVNGLTNTHVDDMPTCSIYAVKIAINSWRDFKKADKEFWFFDYPKNA